MDWEWQELNNRLHGRFGYGDDVHCDDKEEIAILTDYIQQWIGKNPLEALLAQTWLNKLSNLNLETPKGIMIRLIVDMLVDMQILVPGSEELPKSAIIQTCKELEDDPIEEIGLEQTQQSTQYSYDEFSNSQLLLVSDVLDGNSKVTEDGNLCILT